MARPSTSSAAAPPPVYQPGNREIYAPSVSSLPAYTRQPPPRPTTSRRELTEHVFELRTKYDKVWLTWKLMSYAREPDQLPTFLEGNNIRGSLTLNLEQPDAIQTISISVSGSFWASLPCVPLRGDRLNLVSLGSCVVRSSQGTGRKTSLPFSIYLSCCGQKMARTSHHQFLQ